MSDLMITQLFSEDNGLPLERVRENRCLFPDREDYKGINSDFV